MTLNQSNAVRERIKEFAGQEDVLCLQGIDQPLVTDMQNCIRLQRAQLDHAAKSIRHILNRIANHESVRYHCGARTQTYGLLTEALADIENVPHALVCDHYLPGSSYLHCVKEDK
jgi:hypothetical protein